VSDGEGLKNKAIGNAVKEVLFHAQNNRLHVIVLMADPFTGRFEVSTNANPITIPGILNAADEALAGISFKDTSAQPCDPNTDEDDEEE
jgi:pectin methylesterase-like acyl-CoA thioesterase